MCPELSFATQSRGFVSREGGGMPPPLLRHNTVVLCCRRGACPTFQQHNTEGSRDVNLVDAVPVLCVAGGGGLPPLLLRNKTTVLRRLAGEWRLAADMSAVSHSRHVCCVTLQTCALCHTADMSAVPHSRHACCFTQQTYRLCHTGDMSAL